MGLLYPVSDVSCRLARRGTRSGAYGTEADVFDKSTDMVGLVECGLHGLPMPLQVPRLVVWVSLLCLEQRGFLLILAVERPRANLQALS